MANGDAVLNQTSQAIEEKKIESSETKISLGDDGYFTITLTVKGDREIDVNGILSSFNEHEYIQAIAF